MNTRSRCRAGRRPRPDHVLRRTLRAATMLCALTGLWAAPAHAGIAFARGAPVPRSVQEFAWRVIETRCNYQSFERAYRSFWAYHVSVGSRDEGIVYSISIVSDVPWKKTVPPANIEMTIVDDGRIRLVGLKSSFVTCSP